MVEDINIFLEKYNVKLFESINRKCKEFHITQKQLSEMTDISQSTLSKLLSGKTKFTVEQMVRISAVFKTDISEFLSFQKMGAPFIDDSYSRDYVPENDNFVCDTDRPAFKGYIGNQYYIYFYSTIKSEKKMIHGELSFQKSEENRCKISLQLDTGKKDVSGNKVTKKYTGEMIISIPLSACYCILTSREIGEMCFISFHHMFLFNQNMLCRVGTALTTSSGENRRPTIHRMVISKYPFDLEDDSNDLHFLRGQLKLNNSKIIIKTKEFENLVQMVQENTDVDNNIIKFFNNFRELASCEEYFIIDESKLLDSNIPVITKVNGISLLREASIADKYSKISTKTDEFLFEYISHNKLGNE